MASITPQENTDTTYKNDMDTTKTITHIGLCAGYGGIELGLSRAIPNLRSVALCEIEAFAAANLVSKMEAGLMDAAPIWTDLKTFPWAEFRGKVDILTGGYPCQPFSAAGKRLGKEDPRHLWPFIADGIAAMRPSICFFENVEGHISMGLSDVIEDLAGMGYRTTWGIFSAREVGAPHQRKRVFILAHSRHIEPQGWCGDADGQQSGAWRIPRGESASRHDQVWPSRPGEPQHGWEPPRVVGNAASKRSCGGSEDGANQQSEMLGTGYEAMADSHRIDRSAPAEGREHDRQVGSAGEGLGNSKDGNQSGDALQLRQREAQHRRASGSVDTRRRQTQSSMGGDADGSTDWMDDAELFVTSDNRTDELRLLGNGVVPATAERAFRTLLKELTE